jgi:hypothetical protein
MYQNPSGGNFVMNVVPMGGKNSSRHAERAMRISFADLPNTLYQADGVLIYANSVEELAQHIVAFHERVRRDGWILKASKVIFASQDVVFHGVRLRHHNGRTSIAPYARSRNAFKDLHRPKTAFDLWKLLGITAYNQRHIQDASRRFKPLQDLLTRKLEGTARNKAAAKAKSIKEEDWTTEIDQVFRDLVHANNHLIMTAIIDPRQRLCVYADANPMGWGAVLVNVPVEDIAKPHAERNISILACTGGVFSAAQSRMFVSEQEMLATRLALHRFRWAIQPGQPTTVYVYSDSNVTVQMLQPDSDWTKTRSSRLLRHVQNWQIELINFGITFQHVDGEDTNWLADQLSRAQISHGEPDMDVPRDSMGEPLDFENQVRINAFTHNVEPRNGDWVFPTLARVREISGPHGESNADFLALVESVNGKFDPERRIWVTQDAKIIIPQDEDLRNTLMAIAHNVIGGHFATDATRINLADYVYWPEMKTDVGLFVHGCIHCMSDSTKVSHEQGQTIEATRSGQVLCGDYMYLGPSPSGTHLLILSDKFSALSTYYFGDSEASEHVVRSLLHWFSIFGYPEVLNLDQGPGFTAGVTKELSQRLGTRMHFVSAGSHWANGAQERRVGILRNIFNRLLGEMQFPHHRWDELAPIVFGAFNNKPSPTRGGYAPITLMTGLPRVNPVSFIVDTDTKSFVSVPLNDEQIRTYMDEFAKASTERTLYVNEVYQAQVEARLARQRRARSTSHYMPVVGDYVMVADNITSPIRFMGPAQVTALPAEHHGYVATVLFLAARTSATKDIHVRDLRFFDHKDLIVTPALTRQAQHLRDRRFNLREILDYKSGHFQVEWDVEPLEITWEPVESIYADVPAVVEAYIASAPARRAAAVRKSLGLT